MKNKKMRGKLTVAALLLALSAPAAYGQSDGFFSNAGGVRDGNGAAWSGISGGSWNDINGGGDGAAWNGMENATPVGGGLLVLALSGVCYAGAKKLKSRKLKD